MIDQKEVIDFFDKLAPCWDEHLVRNEAAIASILDGAEAREGIDVLDVACGTGVLFPDYIKRKVKSVTAIDISSEMARLAKEKAEGTCISVICGDVEATAFDKQFDLVMVYNAFPHFPDPVSLVKCLAGLLKPGGRLCVAHGFSKKLIDNHHKGSAAHVSNGLYDADKLAELFKPYCDVDIVISDENMYQVCGKKR